MRVTAVVFPGFELLDLFGPLELFGMLQEKASLLVAAQAAGPVSSSHGPKVVAEAALDGVVSTDVLLVPGGFGTRTVVKDEALLASIRRLAARSQYVASVCTGAGILAKAGLLDGKRATSNKRAFDWAASQGPATTWVRRARWVEDGNTFTSSGVSAGMDMALALIQRHFGRPAALEAASRAEYTWHEDSTVDPFAG